jgi:hypothetical protein
MMMMMMVVVMDRTLDSSVQWPNTTPSQTVQLQVSTNICVLLLDSNIVVNNISVQVY